MKGERGAELIVQTQGLIELPGCSVGRPASGNGSGEGDQQAKEHGDRGDPQAWLCVSEQPRNECEDECRHERGGQPDGEFGQQGGEQGAMRSLLGDPSDISASSHSLIVGVSPSG